MPKQANMCMSCSNFVHHLSSSHTALVPRAQALSPRVRRSSAVCRFRCSRGTHRPPLSPPRVCVSLCVYNCMCMGIMGRMKRPSKILKTLYSNVNREDIGLPPGEPRSLLKQSSIGGQTESPKKAEPSPLLHGFRMHGGISTARSRTSTNVYTISVRNLYRCRRSHRPTNEIAISCMPWLQ